jgi:cell wall-associated NlpC family hydrolase
MDDINSTNDKINQTRQDIKNAEQDIQKAMDELNKEQDLFGKRLRAMYISGTSSYLSILLESQDFGDFLSRVDNISRIVKYDNKILKDIKDKSDEINKKKIALGDENKKLLSLQQNNEKKLADLNSAKDDQLKLVAQIKAQQRVYASRMQDDQALINETLKQIQAIKEKAKKPPVVASRGDTSTSVSSGEAIVAYASNYLGVPYVWGGNTPSGFDCSGFTKYVYGHFGITLNRRASQQANQGVPVSRDQLQPGDLVFFGNPIYHVGIYVGNGCFIHAPQTGDVVKITSLKYMNLTQARRLIR